MRKYHSQEKSFLKTWLDKLKSPAIFILIYFTGNMCGKVKIQQQTLHPAVI